MRVRAWRPDPLRSAGLVAIVIGAVVLVAYFASSSYFHWDDFVNVEEGRGVGLSFSSLTRATSAECCLGLRVVPFHRLAYGLIAAHTPLPFGAAMAVMIMLFALTIVALYALLAEICGPRPGLLVVTLTYAVATVHVGVLQWFSSSIDRVPATLFSLLCMVAYVRFYRTRRWPFLVVSAASLLVALLFHTKPALVPLYLVLLNVLVLGPGKSLVESMVDVARDWWVWLVYAVPVGVYLAVYTGRYHEAVAPASPLRLGRYLVSLWFSVTVPGFFGLHIPRGTSPALAALLIAASQAALVALAAVAVLRRTEAWRAGAFLAVVFLANAVVVGFTRIAVDSGAFGPDAFAYALRYSEEMGYLYPVALAAAFLRPSSGGAERGRPEWLTAFFSVAQPRRAGWVAAGVATSLFVVLSVVGDIQASSTPASFGPYSRAFVANLRQDVKEAASTSGRVAVLDDVAPYRVVPFPPFNRYSAFLPLISGRLTFDSRAPDLYEVASDGRLHAVRWVTHAITQARTAVAAGTAGVAPPESANTSTGELCVQSDTAKPVVGWALGRPTPPGTRAYLRVRLRATGVTRDDVAVVAIDRGEGLGLGPDPFARFPRTGGDIVVRLGDPGVAHIVLILPIHSTVCIGDLEVGLAEAR